MAAQQRRWDDQPRKHGIVLMHGSTLMCSCGTEIQLAGKDLEYSQRIQYDLLLDRHATHKARKERSS